MTDNPPAIPESLWEQIWSNLPRILIVISTLSVLYAVLTWFTGGLRPQSQIDLENLKLQMSEMRSGVAVCNSRLDALPRASDFAEWQAHLSRLDAVYDSLRDRLTAEEYATKDNTAGLRDLLSGTKTPVRNPR